MDEMKVEKTFTEEGKPSDIKKYNELKAKRSKTYFHYNLIL